MFCPKCGTKVEGGNFCQKCNPPNKKSSKRLIFILTIVFIGATVGFGGNWILNAFFLSEPIYYPNETVIHSQPEESNPEQPAAYFSEIATAENIPEIPATEKFEEEFENDIEPEPAELAYINLTNIQTRIIAHRNQSAENMANAFSQITSYSPYFQRFHINMPPGVSLADNFHTFARGEILSEVDILLGGTALFAAYEWYSNITGAIETVNSLFNVSRTPTALMATVATDMLPFNTLLLEIEQNGLYDMFLAQHAFGNFIQRIASVNSIYENSWLYMAEHMVMLNWYSQFVAHEHMAEMLANLHIAEELPEPSEEEISFIVAAIENSLNNARSFITAGFGWDEFGNDLFRAQTINPIELNFDGPRTVHMERNNILRTSFADLAFSGIFGLLMSTGLEDNANRTQRSLFTSLTRLNNFAANAVNADIAELNALKASIDLQADFFNALIENAENEEFLPYFAALAALLAESESDFYDWISFDRLTADFMIIGSRTIAKLDILIDLYTFALMESGERTAFLQSLSAIQDNIFTHIGFSDVNPAYLTMFQVAAIGLKRELITDWMEIGNAVDTHVRNAVSGNFGLNYATISEPRNERFVFIEERTFNSGWTTDFVTFYNLDGGIIYIGHVAQGLSAYFDGFGNLIYATDDESWRERIEGNVQVSEWLFENALRFSLPHYQSLRHLRG
ncbi:MAG: zinc ribbon domain-containing protein [Defluviitaleaceae bacterium]|nr:zinc ribbon domain-containing protein [Defluviitaleaceae bacterium]